MAKRPAWRAVNLRPDKTVGGNAYCFIRSFVIDLPRTGEYYPARPKSGASFCRKCGKIDDDRRRVVKQILEDSKRKIETEG